MDGKQKLKDDLKILEIMAEEMEDYLDSSHIFFPLPGRGNVPLLTLGGYLMRQHRLLVLSESLLGKEEQTRLQAAITLFNESVAPKKTRYEAKAHRELEARVRQWDAYLDELDEDLFVSAAYYGTAVEARVLITDLFGELQRRDHQVQLHISERIGQLDEKLRIYWRPGEFVWPSEWKAAYPQAKYWWLYGKPIE